MRRRDEAVRSSGKSKMTVMMFQLEGADDTLQEGIRTISQAIGNVMNPSRPLLQLATPSTTSSGSDKPAVEETPTSELIPPSEIDDESSEPRQIRPSKPRSPKILPLDLKSNNGSLEEFCAAKAVGDNDTRRYLAISFWLKEKLNVTAVTMDHVHTCYRFLGWQTPADASSPLRNMKLKGWFDKGTERGSYAINHVGENEVMRMAASK